MIKFPKLRLSDWKPTRDSIHGFSKILGKIREAHTPKQKHHWNISLRCSTSGLTTTPVPYNGNKTFEVELDFTSHSLNIKASTGENSNIAIEQQKPVELVSQISVQLAKHDIGIDFDKEDFSQSESLEYNKKDVEKYWKALLQIDQIFKEFKGSLREETSPVQLWPHHFDLAFSWFSGRLIPGKDPEDEENADEQMGFGFSTGDESIPNPYFYATAYPLPDNLDKVNLPKGAKWNEEGFTGGFLMYDELARIADSKSLLMEFLGSMQRAGSYLMK